jgi:hypothetical protein
MPLLPTEFWQSSKAQNFQKKPVLLKVEFANNIGFCNTLEGQVPYEKGDAILEGTEGENWPVKRTVFDRTYEHVKGNLYRKKPMTVSVICLDQKTEIQRPDGSTLKGEPGDWLVRYSEDDFAIVRSDIFAKTYERVE